MSDYGFNLVEFDQTELAAEVFVLGKQDAFDFLIFSGNVAVSPTPSLYLWIKNRETLRPGEPGSIITHPTSRRRFLVNDEVVSSVLRQSETLHCAMLSLLLLRALELTAPYGPRWTLTHSHTGCQSVRIQ